MTYTNHLRQHTPSESGAIERARVAFEKAKAVAADAHASAVEVAREYTAAYDAALRAAGKTIPLHADRLAVVEPGLRPQLAERDSAAHNAAQAAEAAQTALRAFTGLTR